MNNNTGVDDVTEGVSHSSVEGIMSILEEKKFN